VTRKRYFIFLIISIALVFGLTPLGGYGGHHLKFLAASILYFIFTWYFLLQTKTRREGFIVVLILALPPLLLYLPLYTLHSNSIRFSLPSTISHFIGIAFGWCAYLSTKRIKIILSVILIIASLWVAFFGYTMWLNKDNFGTYTGKVNFKTEFSVVGVNQFGDTITSEDIKGKVVVFDFWYSGCGVCYREFPGFQKLYNSYAGNQCIEFFAVNKPTHGDTIGQAYKMISDRAYTFPSIIAVTDTLPKLFGVSVYPTLIILDKSGTVVYRGRNSGADKTIKKLLERDI